MFYPNFIKENSCIGIPAPSAGANDNVRKNKMLNAKKTLEEMGYQLILSDNLMKGNMGRSADKSIRGKEINDMFQNKEIELIPGDRLSPVQRVITRHDTVLRSDLNQYSARMVRAYTIQSGG